jgi:hypothetical protein
MYGHMYILNNSWELGRPPLKLGAMIHSLKNHSLRVKLYMLHQLTMLLFFYTSYGFCRTHRQHDIYNDSKSFFRCSKDGTVLHGTLPADTDSTLIKLASTENPVLMPLQHGHSQHNANTILCVSIKGLYMEYVWHSIFRRNAHSNKCYYHLGSESAQSAMYLQ